MATDPSSGTRDGDKLRPVLLAVAIAALAGIVLAALLTPADDEATDTSASERQVRAELESTLKNVATAEESYLTTNGSYTTSLQELAREGLQVAPGVSVRIRARGTREYCIEASAPDAPVLHYDSAEALPAEGPCSP